MSFALTTKDDLLCKLRQTLSDSEVDIMRKCLSNSENVYSGTVNGRIACAWGLIPPTLMTSKAYVWLYHNDLVELHKFHFVRQSQIAVAEMLKEYEELHGHAQGSNERGIRWLKWLGAEFKKDKTVDLIPFIIRRKDG